MEVRKGREKCCNCNIISKILKKGRKEEKWENEAHYFIISLSAGKQGYVHPQQKAEKPSNKMKDGSKEMKIHSHTRKMYNKHNPSQSSN